MIVENVAYPAGAPGDDRVVTYSTSTRKLYTRDGSEELQQNVFDSTEYFRLNQEEIESLRNLLKDYDRLKQLVKDHYPEDML